MPSLICDESKCRPQYLIWPNAVVVVVVFLGLLKRKVKEVDINPAHIKSVITVRFVSTEHQIVEKVERKLRVLVLF